MTNPNYYTTLSFLLFPVPTCWVNYHARLTSLATFSLKSFLNLALKSFRMNKWGGMSARHWPSQRRHERKDCYLWLADIYIAVTHMSVSRGSRRKRGLVFGVYSMVVLSLIFCSLFPKPPILCLSRFRHRSMSTKTILVASNYATKAIIIAWGYWI